MADTFLDFATRIGQLIKGAVWQKPGGGFDLNTKTVPGIYPVTALGSSLNLPENALGDLEVMGTDTYLVQMYVTWGATRRIWVRYRNPDKTTWGDWASLRWELPSRGSDTDFNTLTMAGVVAITSAVHTNSPIALIGHLEVSVVAAFVWQRFTDVNRVTYIRNRINGTWTPWEASPSPATLTSLTAQVAAATRLTPPRQQIGTWSPTATPASQATMPSTLSHDRLTAWSGDAGDGGVRETKDYGATWTVLHNFARPTAWVQQLGDGELLVSVGTGTDPRELWRSNGYPNLGAGATWTKVLTATGPSITFSGSWGFSQHDNIVLVNEYGPKFGSGGVVEGQNARYSYMSTDYGKTWRQIFDLNAYVTGFQGRAASTGIHLHGVAWDPYWDRIWITFGDDVNGTIYSDDLGVTWQTAFYGTTANAPWQVVGILPMPKCILFGTDTAPNGVVRIDRTGGKRGGTYPHVQAYTIPGDDGVTRTHLCHVMYRVGRVGDDGPAILGFSAESNPAASFIVATYDGYDFKLLWQDSQVQAAGKGVRSVIGPTLTGELIASSDDQRTANMRTMWRGPAPIY